MINKIQTTIDFEQMGFKIEKSYFTKSNSYLISSYNYRDLYRIRDRVYQTEGLDNIIITFVHKKFPRYTINKVPKSIIKDELKIYIKNKLKNDYFNIIYKTAWNQEGRNVIFEANSENKAIIYYLSKTYNSICSNITQSTVVLVAKNADIFVKTKNPIQCSYCGLDHHISKCASQSPFCINFHASVMN